MDWTRPGSRWSVQLNWRGYLSLKWLEIDLKSTPLTVEVTRLDLIEIQLNFRVLKVTWHFIIIES